MDTPTSRLSFGCEFEFALAHLPPGRDDPHEGQPGLAPLLRIDNVGRRGENIFQHLRNTLKSHGIRVRDPLDTSEGSETRDDKAETVPPRLRNIGMWDVTMDASVAEHDLKMYNWQSIELRTPAFRTREVAYREIAYVLNLLKSNYRLRINTSTGFHIHVGNGTEWLPVDNLRRLGALLWASDSMLSRLHAPWRRTNEYSNSIRYGSILACRNGIENSLRASVVGKGPTSGKSQSKTPSASPSGSSGNGNSSDSDGPFNPLAAQALPPLIGNGSSGNDSDSDWAVVSSVPQVLSAELPPPVQNNSDSGSGSDGAFNPPATKALAELPPPARDSSGSDSDGAFNPPAAQALAELPVTASSNDSNAATTTSGTHAKLRPHDISQLPESYKNDRIRGMANWARISWVPSVANLVDPGSHHAPGDAKLCYEDCTEHPATTLREGVAEIMKCDSTTAVGSLLRATQPQVLNYNFRNYTPEQADDNDYNIRTIEFREAGGTLDEEWACVWSRICTGIVDFCGKASESLFQWVIDKLAKQEDRDQQGLEQGDDERYDVCDFLDDICLFAEAEWVRQRERKSGPPL